MKTFLKNAKGLVPCERWEPDCWINIEVPTENDKNYLINELQIPASFYSDVEDADENPRIEIEDDWFLIILRIPFKNEDTKLPFSTVPLGLIFKDNIFISVCFYPVAIIPDFILYTQRKNILKNNNFDFVLELLLSSSIWFLKYLKLINIKIKAAEEQIEKSIKNEDLQTLLQIEKCLVFFTTSLKGNDTLVQRLKNLKNHKSTIDPDLIEDVSIELRQAQETAGVYSDILSGMMDAYASVISNNLNIIMKRLTSFSIILMIPTMISSFYGMNVPNFLENSHFAFGGIASFALLSSIGALYLLKKKGWF